MPSQCYVSKEFVFFSLFVGVNDLLCDCQSFVLLFNYFFAIFRFLFIVLMQSLSIFTGRFIVLVVFFIFSYFDILPNLSDFINVHRNTSRMVLWRSSDHDSQFSIRCRDASTYINPLLIRLFSASIIGMYSMVILFDFMSSLILSVYSMMLCCLTNSWRLFCIW